MAREQIAVTPAEHNTTDEINLLGYKFVFLLLHLFAAHGCVACLLSIHTMLGKMLIYVVGNALILQLK